MARCRTAVFAMLLVIVALLGNAIQASADAPPPPSVMASTGDSITRGFDATSGCLLTDCPGYSWSTGDSAAVNSHFQRLASLNPSLVAYNDAKTGARMADLYGQLDAAAAQQAEYVTVLMGANDVCTSSVDSMTPTAVFETQFSAALANFFALAPTSLLYVSSLPNVNQLYDVLHNNLSARFTWNLFKICQSALPPGGTDASRAAVYDREVAFNQVLEAICSGYAGCLYDGGAGFAYQFTAADISTVDYFHPSITGQNSIADLTWSQSFWGP